ncbi:hypothetical protein EON64_12695, partial [archaeon]
MLELIVHNLSHSDMVLGISNGSTGTFSKPEIVARPKFSCFKAISEIVYESVKSKKDDICLDYMHPFSREKGAYLSDSKVAVGFSLRENNITVNNSRQLRFKSSLEVRFPKDDDQPVCIDGVFFPLLATLIPKWERTTQQHSGTAHCQKVVVLVSGKGQPQDERADSSDNSTEFVGKLIALFLQRAHPELQVRLLHSQTNLFRYDENIWFVKRELLPLISGYRDELVQRHSADWRSKVHLTLSFADGSSARTSSIHASLKSYRPSFMHFWVLKTFWRERRVCEEDIEWHGFDEIATNPALSLGDIDDPQLTMVLQEMDKFREAVQRDASAEQSDLLRFWLRKTKKPVLAVLLVQKPNQPPSLYRGSNMEVSAPSTPSMPAVHYKLHSPPPTMSGV